MTLYRQIHTNSTALYCFVILVKLWLLPSYRLIVFSCSIFVLCGSAYLQILITTTLVTVMLSIITSYQLVRALGMFHDIDRYLCRLATLVSPQLLIPSLFVADTKVSEQHFDWYFCNFALWYSHRRTTDACCTVSSRSKPHDIFDELFSMHKLTKWIAATYIKSICVIFGQRIYFETTHACQVME